MRLRPDFFLPRLPLVVGLAILLVGCGSGIEPEPQSGQASVRKATEAEEGIAAEEHPQGADTRKRKVPVELPWDSQNGNPTHATHSYMAEYAIDSLKAAWPELQTYRARIVDGANLELHELPVSDPEQEALRIEVGGTNWGADCPEVLWNRARAAYAAGDKGKAYWYVGIVLHYVSDMGAPAHALHVVHQGDFSQRDNFEVCALQRWSPRWALNRVNPYYAQPQEYVLWSGDWARSDWYAAYPGRTYTLNFYPFYYFLMTTRQAALLKDRQGRSATACKWALESAVTHW